MTGSAIASAEASAKVEAIQRAVGWVELFAKPITTSHVIDGFREELNPSYEFAVTNNPSTSLRASGSRECAPDDRLREAIQKATSKDWIASSQELLAMTNFVSAEPATSSAS
jgi:hypothetical protein